MARKQPQPPLWTDKVGMLFILINSMVNALIRAVTYPFLDAEHKAANYYTDIMFTFLRTMTGSLSPSQDAVIQQSVQNNYLKHIMYHKDLTAATEILPEGVKAHWVGDKHAEFVVLHFHGGGYMTAASAGHFVWFHETVKAFRVNGKSVAFLVLGYTRALEASYPTQLQEGVGLLRYALETLDRDPSKILVAGDSAGGNLAIGVLSHLLHPHPKIPPLKLSSPLHAMVLLSPGVSTKTNEASWTRNAMKDNLSVHAKHRWYKAWLDGARSDPWNNPLASELNWWEKTGDVVQDILVWAGGNEVMLDSIVEFGEKLRKGAAERKGSGKKAEVDVIVTPKHYHDQMVVERVLGYKEPGDGAKVVEAWLLARV